MYIFTFIVIYSLIQSWWICLLMSYCSAVHFSTLYFVHAGKIHCFDIMSQWTHLTGTSIHAWKQCIRAYRGTAMWFVNKIPHFSAFTWKQIIYFYCLYIRISPSPKGSFHKTVLSLKDMRLNPKLFQQFLIYLFIFGLIYDL